MRFKPKMSQAAMAVGGIGAAAVFAVGGLFAAFTDTATTAPQTINTGNVDVTLSNPTAVAFTDTINDLVPGDTVNRFVNVNNAGTTAWSTNTIKATNTGGVLITDANGIRVGINSCPTAYNTTTGVCSSGEIVVQAPASPSALTTAKTMTNVPVGQALYLKVTTSLPAAATNTVANTSTTLNYTVDVTQRNGVTTFQ